MGSILLAVFLAVLKDTTALPEAVCEYTGKIPFRWKIEIPKPTYPPLLQSTVIPEGRKVCWKDIPQAQPYPYRKYGGVQWEEPLSTDNFLRGDIGSYDNEITVRTCEFNPSCVIYWFNSQYKDKGYLSTYMKFRPQLIKYGGDVPANDTMRIKMYLTEADCALPFEELAKKNITQWYPEGGYFHLIMDSPGMLKYEGTGQLIFSETFYDEYIWSF